MVSDIGIWFRSVCFEAMTTSLTWQNGNAQMRQRDTSLEFWVNKSDKSCAASVYDKGLNQHSWNSLSSKAAVGFGVLQ